MKNLLFFVIFVLFPDKEYPLYTSLIFVIIIMYELYLLIIY
jgi:hypothetical protein